MAAGGTLALLLAGAGATATRFLSHDSQIPSDHESVTRPVGQPIYRVSLLAEDIYSHQPATEPSECSQTEIAPAKDGSALAASLTWDCLESLAPMERRTGHSTISTDEPGTPRNITELFGPDMEHVAPARTSIVRSAGTRGAEIVSCDVDMSSVRRLSRAGLFADRSPVSQSAEVKHIPPPQPQRIATAISPTSAESVLKVQAVEDSTAESSEPEADIVAVEIELAWPRPKALVAQLDELQRSAGDAGTWGRDTLKLLEQLSAESDLSSRMSLYLINQLDRQVEQGNTVADSQPAHDTQAALRRAAYALQRRLDVWRAVQEASAPQYYDRMDQHVESVDPVLMLDTANRVAAKLAQEANGEGWMEFLLIDDLRQLAQSDTGNDGQKRQEIANLVLRRIIKANLDENQASFLAEEPLASLQVELRQWATHHVDYRQFLASIERFESLNGNSASRQLSNYWIALHMSLDPIQRQVSDAFELHYRNANVRVSVSESMLNRLVPELPQEVEPVNENMMETRVTGQSTSQTRLHVNLVPDQHRLRVLLEARGQMKASTTSRKGPVTLFNRNQSNFVVKRVVTMDSNGIQMGSTNAAATGDTRLVGLQTMYDRMPLIGSMVRSVAKKTYDEQHGLARRLMVNRVTNQASDRLEKAMDQQIVQAQQKFEQKIVEPLKQLELNPTTMEMTTTDDRLVFRSRLAGDTQLAAFTPRPRARADNLVSIQLHESALNNFVQKFELDGLGGSVEEIHAHIVTRLETTMGVQPKQVELPIGVRMKLADEDAVTVRCEEGNVIVSVKFDYLIDEARVQPKVYKNFAVQAVYQPHRDRSHAYLQREDTIRIAGRLRPFERSALASVFGKVLSKDQKLHLIDPNMMSDQRFADLQIGQLYIDHGWIGMSLVEENPVEGTAGKPQEGGRRKQMTR
jgi:hypothetical protein